MMRWKQDSGGGDGDPGPPKDYPARRARQGMVVLNTPWRRTIFFGALAVALTLAAITIVAFYPTR